MPSFAPYALVVALSVAAWAIAERFKLPASGFLGPLLLVGAGAILGLPQPVYPDWSILLLQITFGGFLGCQADRDSVARVRALGRPVALATAWTIVSAFVIALLLAGLTRLDMTSSFLSAVPGGVAEMSAMSISMEANTAIVAALQSLRVIATMGLVPLLSTRIMIANGGYPAATGAGTSAAARGSAVSSEPYLVDDVPARWHLWGRNHTAGWLATLAVGLVGGLLCTYLQVPAGGILGSMATVAIGRIAGMGLQKPPPVLRLVALMGMGSYVGTSFSAQTLLQLRDIALAAVLVTAATVGSGMALAKVLERYFGMDAPTALLACAPAGVTQMAVIADEIGSDVLVVTLFQLTRLMSCVFILPMIYAFVT